MGIVNNQIQSAFRARSNSSQEITANELDVQVIYDLEEFDLRGEYNPSTFVPDYNGVYSVVASAIFFPNSEVTEDYRTFIAIRVGGETVAFDNDYWGENLIDIGNTVSVSAILYLEAGDVVDVVFESTVDGVIDARDGTTFQAARFPSPISSITPPQTPLASSSY